jgi:hypothetical protein
VAYFALTTLSTVGYGDYSPGGPDEKPNIVLILGALMLISGVTFFSTLTSNFIDIIQNMKLQKFTINEELFNQWFNLLKRFNNNRELSKNLKEEVYSSFTYFCENDRSQVLVEKKEYFDSLPRKIKRYIMR